MVIDGDDTPDFRLLLFLMCTSLSVIVALFFSFLRWPYGSCETTCRVTKYVFSLLLLLSIWGMEMELITKRKFTEIVLINNVIVR
jgi:hypothetical protein